MTRPTPPTGAWRLICPAENPKSAREYVGALLFSALWEQGAALGLRQTWDEKSAKLYQGLPKPGIVTTAGPVKTGSTVPVPERLDVPYYLQHDSLTDQGARMCRTSSYAMALKFLKPGALTGSSNADDEYLARVRLYGDTTETWPQLKAMAHFGIPSSYRQNLDWNDLDEQLRAGKPIPIGHVHNGHVSHPTGGGHWIIVIGKKGSSYLVHDPAGEADLENGGFVRGGSGKAVLYSRKNLGPRWMKEGPGTGWGVLL